MNLMLPKISHEKSAKIFSILLGLAFASLFFRQGVIHLVAALFVIALIVCRPRLPWIAPFWWMIGFIAWEWASDQLGPYHGDGMEGAGIGYHFIYLFLPLCIPVIHYAKLLIYVTVGATISAALLWAQAFMGIDLTSKPFRINWASGGKIFDRTPGFNNRPWETQFIHSAIAIALLPFIEWKKARAWLLLTSLLSGVILPQIRAVIVAFIGAMGIQMMFWNRPKNTKTIVMRLALFGIITVLFIGAVAALRPDFTRSLMSGNGRDKIFPASFHIFTQYPHTGIGGGEHFNKHYRKAWVELGMYDEKNPHPLITIGHPHSDALLLLAHHGWPALLLWTAFILHCLIFVWKNGNNRDRTMFFSLVVFHHLAGLSETYLDYSNTTYTIFLCYGLALHSPIKRYQAKLTENNQLP